MSTLELKQKVINKIESLENNDLLEEVYRILEMGDGDFEVYELSSQQKSAINAGLEDVKNGRVTSHEMAKMEIEKWLSK
jgi:hypothetical protein